MKELILGKRISKLVSVINNEEHRVQGLRVLAVIIARKYLARMRDKTSEADDLTRKQQ